MNEEQLASLAADIVRNGLLLPIRTYEGMILDGRNRYRACELACVTPRFLEYTGDNPVAFAFSSNEERRHLTSGQRAALAVDIKPRLEEEARKRKAKLSGTRRNPGEPREQVVQKVAPPDERKSRTEAARIAGTNHAYVNAAEKIKAGAPEVFDKLKAGKISLQDAKREVAKIPTDPWRPDEKTRRESVESGKSVVANAERDKNLITWAEKVGCVVYVDRGTRYGNPFVLPDDGSREEVCDAYAEHYLPFKPSILKRAAELRGRVLVCHCYPERCHAESLIKLIA